VSRARIDGRGRAIPVCLMLLAVAALVISGIEPYDRMTWWLEVTPVIVGLAALAVTWRVFPLTTLLYCLLFLHAVVLMVGGHYSYARVPIGFTVQEMFDLARNPYDRFGHFAQGFVPAILAREVLLRCSPLGKGRWLFAISTSFCLAFSAFYEIIEWWVAVVAGDGSTDFLALQGDPWDTQWDMFTALLGAISALAVLSRWHDHALENLRTRGRAPW
jgi:putative membrane protein